MPNEEPEKGDKGIMRSGETFWGPSYENGTDIHATYTPFLPVTKFNII